MVSRQVERDIFIEWNLRLLRSFFSQSSKRQEVFLRVDRHFLDQIGPDLGGDEGFRKAVIQGPSWTKKETCLTERAIELSKQRQYSSKNYIDPGSLHSVYEERRAPSYLPYLAALVRTSSETTQGFYKKFRQDFELPDTFNSPDMEELERVWADLENWTRQCQGEFGYFHFRRLGGYRRIGAALSQCIAKPKDIENIPVAFAQANVSPGQKLNHEDIVRILNEAKNSYWYYSKGFTEALGHSEFYEPLQEIISSSYDDWDGTFPSNCSDNSATNNSTSSSSASVPQLSLALALESKKPLGFSPRWYVPALEDSGSFELSWHRSKWFGSFLGTEGVCAQNDTSLVEELWNIASQNSSPKRTFELRHYDSENSDPSLIGLDLPCRDLWVLIPRRNPFTGQFELVEGTLPATGAAYLLASPHNTTALKHYLEQKRSGTITEAGGIPNDWLLARLPDCSLLTDEQRLLPDGRPHAHPKPHPIRFTGGRSIRRGYHRMFLPYDLPTIELDAPDGTKIIFSSDIAIKPAEQDFPLNRDDDFKSRERFEVVLSHWNSALYELQAVDKSGKLLGTARLRIAGIDSDAIELENFSLDPLGRPQNSLDGLSGSCLPDNFQALTSCETLSINTHELGTKVEFSETDVSVHQKFLARLAVSKSLSLGSARDFLNRKIQESNLKLEPVFVLLELRHLGHLELSTSSKGHITRVHAVKPRLYKLPLVHAGKEIYGVSGTLNLDHWKALAAHNRSFSAYSSHSSPGMMPSWRLLVSDLKKTQKQFWQFELVETSALAVANWSAGFQSIKEQIEHNTMESIGSAAENSLKFNASMGVFRSECNIEAWQLWKVQDLDTWMDQLYMLANKNSSSDSSEYAFVRDASWGKWIATSESARWFANKHNIEGLQSVPINYNHANGTFWIPARIGLPVILERALVMCNGTSPEVIALQRSEQASTTSRISLSRSKGQSPLLLADPFYTDMAEGKWLAFHNVPKQVAQAVANKLGAVLDIF